MSWLITGKQYIPAVIGEAFGGGYFAGYISHTADGNPTHALIVAPRATGATGTGYTLTTSLAWKTTNTTTAGATSVFDGAANTAAMVTAGINDHPAAKFCKDLTIGGFTDWYLPAPFELDIAYFNLKPTTEVNTTTAGINLYSVPQRLLSYTSGNPPQTGISLFSGAQAFVDRTHWSSSQPSNSQGTVFVFGSASASGGGGTIVDLKNANYRVRAFRRIAL
jgi:hypothetical protein